jgi:hypothetical protein
MGTLGGVVQPQEVDMHTVYIKQVGLLQIELNILCSRRLCSQKAVAYNENTY